MPNYLVTYRPICYSDKGLTAIETHGISKYVDFSCRREPDLEHEYPSITALCRASVFAPRLRIGDGIAYITKMGSYEGEEKRHHRLTAILEVIHRFGSHDEAGRWYRAQEGFKRLPSNCMVPDNPPLPLDHTGGISRASLKRLVKGNSPEETIRIWDSGYKTRAREHGVFLVCKTICINLTCPPPVFKEDWKEWCGQVPGTQNPPELENGLWEKVLSRAEGRDTPTS